MAHPLKSYTQSSLSIRLLLIILRIVYKPIIGSATRSVLRERLLDRNNPAKGRWLKQDINKYLSATWKRVHELMGTAELDKLPTTGTRHNVFLAVFTTASYQVMIEQKLSKGYSQTLVADMGWNIYRKMLKLWSIPFKMIYRDRGKRLEKVLGALMIFPFRPTEKPGYEAEVWTEGSDTYTYWTHCPPQTFVRRLIKKNGDRGELEAFYNSWCQYDWPGADIIAGDGEHGHYTRKHTLSKGDSVCDMCWHGRAKKK